MIHRKVEGGSLHYGINIMFDRASYGVIICFPVWIYGYSLFWLHGCNLYVGERVLNITARVRWSRIVKKFTCGVGKFTTPFKTKFVASREAVEDGLIEIPPNVPHFWKYVS